MAVVLAIEPDLRQAAILKRILKDKVKADLVVVDSRDAAIEAIARGVPDVMLLSALLSPRDEDELFHHLRSLKDADHLQTHTIPQLSSSLEDRTQSKGGLLKALRRKKKPEGPSAGCDPDLFADEIKTFIRYAAEKKEERRALVESGRLAANAAARMAVPAPAEPEPAEDSGSTWDDPFAWPSSPSSSKPAPGQVSTSKRRLPAHDDELPIPNYPILEETPEVAKTEIAQPVQQSEPEVEEPIAAAAPAPAPEPEAVASA